MSIFPAPESLAEAASALDASAVMARISRFRTSTWRMLTTLVSPPDDVLVAQLARGAFTVDFLREVRWLGEAWYPEGIRSLRVLETQAHADAADVARELNTRRVAAEPEIDDLAEACAAVHRLCADELAAWSAEREDEAKQLRMAQLDLLSPVSPIRHLARAVAEPSGAHYPAFAGLVLDYLALETGQG